MDELIVQLAHVAERLADLAAILVVAFGTIEAFVRVGRVVISRAASHGARKAIWRQYGMWLLLGLEFALAADIIGSVVTPTWEDIGQLGAIAAIRTFLNYFLGRDLEEAQRIGTGEREAE